MPLRLKLAVGALVTGVVAASWPACAATPEQVDAAVTKAVDWLHKAQNPDGNWELVPKPDPKGGQADVKGKQWGGRTALATYALIAAGDDPQKDLVKPIKFLKEADIEGIYATGLRCQTWLLDKDDKKLGGYIDRDKKQLIESIHTTGSPTDIGFYHYYDAAGKPSDGSDRSVSQYGVLGMWALEQAGAEVPMGFWRLIDTAWRKAQRPDGGWNYSGPKENSTPSMTAAGIATLFITQDYTSGSMAECRGNIQNENIDRGLAWMDKNIAAALHNNHYTMYGIERIGVASGRKYFETVDWYRTGADRLVHEQHPDGSFGDVPDTCFALLFMVRGRAPVVMNKLEYEVADRSGKVEPAAWNERPRDCANFAHWMADDLEHFLNWQIVNLKVPPEELHDSSILYISGSHELNLSEGEIEKLKTYVQQGGMILGNADCNNVLFARSFEKLGQKMFPGYAFRDLPANHVIFTDEQFHAVLPNGKGWKTKMKLRGLSNGIRELMLIAPETDMARAFQTRSDKTRAEIYQLGADIFLYSVDKKNLRNKGDSFLIPVDAKVKTTRSIDLARLQVGANPDPEPAGWIRMAGLLHNQDKVELRVKDAPIDTASLAGVKIAHLTGVGSLKFTEDQRTALKSFVEKGGTLIIDSAGGNVEFAEAAEAELKGLFDKPLEVLPPDSQVYQLPGSKVEEFHYRNYARGKIVGSLRSPQVKAIDVKGRLAVFYSREDLSGGIVGEPIDGIVGYDPATATAIMRNLLLYGAFGFPKPPATQSATKPATRPAQTPAPAQPATAPKK